METRVSFFFYAARIQWEEHRYGAYVRCLCLVKSFELFSVAPQGNVIRRFRACAIALDEAALKEVVNYLDGDELLTLSKNVGGDISGPTVFDVPPV